jgi:hypothetical protein
VLEQHPGQCELAPSCMHDRVFRVHGHVHVAAPLSVHACAGSVLQGWQLPVHRS